MLEIGVAEAQQQIAALLERVQEGEQVIVTREGVGVIRMLPIVSEQEDRRRAEESAARIEARSKTMLGDFSWKTMKRYRDFGRR